MRKASNRSLTQGLGEAAPIDLNSQKRDCAGQFKLTAIIDGQSKGFASVEDKFEALAREWKDFNLGRSVTDYLHAAYLQIIGMVPSVVPILLNKLEKGDGDWLIALKYITGAKVTTPEMQGDFERIQRAWREWGDLNGSGQALHSKARDIDLRRANGLCRRLERRWHDFTERVNRARIGNPQLPDERR